MASNRCSRPRIKYAKALLDWMILSGIGKRAVIGYDTGCTFQSSIDKSDILREPVKENDIRFGERREAFRVVRTRTDHLVRDVVVGAFHAYGHVRKCQLGYHARYQEGMGLEDFEGCERLFSFSNKFAGMAR
jgi:hypothetical protein